MASTVSPEEAIWLEDALSVLGCFFVGLGLGRK